MAQLEVQSNLKCITSGNVPTTENLLDGEFAFGNVGGEPKLYGNVDGTIVDFSGDITIDADTLNGLLSGGNGIEVVKNATGDKVEVKLSNNGFTIGDTAGTVNNQTITLNPLNGGQGAFISVNYNGSMVYCKMTPSGIIVVNPGGTAYGLTSGNVKTLFGNQQSIYGSGNINLYKHNVIISQRPTESDRMCVYCQILSSNNLNINSLTAFQTIVKDDNEFIPATGKLKLYNGDVGSIIGGVCKAGAIEYDMCGKYTNNIDFSSGWVTINATGSLTFYDTVITV